MDAKELKEYRARYQAVDAFEKEEQRQATVDDRWRQLNSLLNIAAALGLVVENDQDEVDIVRRRWKRLKDLYLDRSRGRSR
jgi:hypothetical protein